MAIRQVPPAVNQQRQQDLVQRLQTRLAESGSESARKQLERAQSRLGNPKIIDQNPVFKQVSFNKDTGVTTRNGQITNNQPQGNFEPTTSTEERAQGLIDEDIGRQREMEQSLLGEIITPGSLEEQLEQQKQRGQQELDTFNRIQERNEQIRRQQLLESERSAMRAGEGAEAQFSPGREGPISSGASMVIQEFKTTLNKRIQSQQLAVDNARDQVESARRNLEFAQKQGLSSAVRDARSRLAQAEQQVIREETALQEVQNENTKLALEISKEEAQVRRDAFNFFNSAPEGMFASADVGQLVEMFGFDTGTAFLLKGLDQERQKIKQSDPDYLLKKAELLEKQNQALLGGMTEEQKLILQYGKPVEVGDATFEYDFEKNEWVPVSGNLPAGVRGFSPPAGTKYQWNTTASGGIQLNVQDGDIGGQCGKFVNDILGTRLFGDNFYSDKLVHKNSDVPVPGAVFIQDTNRPYGHVGFIESVLPDGSLAVVDSNVRLDPSTGKGDERIRRRTIAYGSNEYKNIKGYHVPPSIGFTPQGRFSEAQKAILSNIDPAKITSTTMELLESAELTVADLGEFLATEKKQLSPDKKADIEEVIKSIDNLLGFSGYKGLEEAVGFGFQKVLPEILGGGGEESGFVSGSDAENFRKEFLSFRDKLVLPSLDKLKGAMSDKDIQFLRNAATSLSLSQSEKQFIATLNSLKEKYESVLNGESKPDFPLTVDMKIDEKKQVSEMIDKLEAEGVSEQEIKAKLVERNIDPSIFYKN